MTAVFNRDGAPGHLFVVPELDFSDDLFAERVGISWFRLGAWTVTGVRDERNVEDEVFRQSLLLSPKGFAEIFDKLESAGNVIGHLGRPGGFIQQSADDKQYSYSPFHQFPFPFTSTVGEPLVFVRWDTAGAHLFINPDLWLFFELEEKTSGSGIWWDPRKGMEALRQKILDQGNLQIVEIRRDYLLKYLQARQMSLLVGHYRQLLLFDPPSSKVEAFVKEDVALGSQDQGAKAILQNWGLREGMLGGGPYLQRRLHLWFEITPPEIDVGDPWTNPPSFDPYAFTLPTRAGMVAPARWKHFRGAEERRFDGELCDFMDRIYFRQEVLMKYEGASGFEVKDNGSVSSNHWGLVRSTSRIGNELIATAIGDFAEGVTLEEWPHWKQFAVEPPSRETSAALIQEQTIPDAVNALVDALQHLNAVFAAVADSFSVRMVEPLWRGSVDSLAGRQLKWVYPVTADDDEFLKRATLLSTLMIEALGSPALRELLTTIGNDLHMNHDDPPKSLGSRKLLERLTLIAVLIADLHPKLAELPMLVRRAEGKAQSEDEVDLQLELESSYKRVRQELAPLAFLYDLRNFGGLAHTPNKERASSAAAQMGLPEANWHRTDFLRLLELVTDSIHLISEHLWATMPA